MKKLFFFLMIASLTTMIACKGEQGDPGPAGVAGPAGPTGPAGADGQDGKDADIQSLVVSISSTDWAPSASDYVTKTISTPLITQDILDNGLVIAYLRTPDLFGISFSSWTALPFSISRTTGTHSFSYSIKVGAFTLRENATNTDLLKINCDLRIVVVNTQGMMAPVNWNNYQEVVDYFQLEE